MDTHAGKDFPGGRALNGFTSVYEKPLDVSLAAFLLSGSVFLLWKFILRENRPGADSNCIWIFRAAQLTKRLVGVAGDTGAQLPVTAGVWKGSGLCWNGKPPLRREIKAMRFGLCCIFMNEPIRFRTTTARALASSSRPEQQKQISAICLENARSLHCAVETVARLGIGAFRISSTFFPRYTHPAVGYTLADLPAGQEIEALLSEVNQLRSRLNIRLSFHPDQFVSISSLRDDVVQKSLAELEYQGLVAEMIGADVITIHAGGRQGGKEATLQRFQGNFPLLSERVRSRLALENDDISYTVKDLLPVCDQLGIPLVYDVHHHRCNPDGLSVMDTTRQALATWQRHGREPWVHVSSPRNGWGEGNPRLHADYINPEDFPDCWKRLEITIDVEAKAKELAVLRLMRDLGTN